jgi:hypothetical protein
MWISAFVVTFAVAVASCIAAIIMQPKFLRGGRTGTPAPRQSGGEGPGLAIRTPALAAQEYAGDGAPRPVSSSLPEHLRSHYRPVLNEPIPARLMTLLRRL